MDEVRSDADDPEDGEQPQIEQRRVGSPTGKTARNAKHPVSVVHLTTLPVFVPRREVQVEAEQGDQRHAPQPHHAGEL